MDIFVKEALELSNSLFIDVRSEGEFNDDHIPNAINIPILDNEERHIVGYTYKQVSKDKAYELGYQIFEKKISEFEKIVNSNLNKNIIFYCFRGGTRSTVFSDYFNKKGINVYKLDGGYKKYREFVREEIQKILLPKKIIVIYGYTGSGKTRLIKKLANSIDLEGLAMHRSSLFGAVGLKPNTQKLFETLLYFELKKNRDYLILEGESRKIGNVYIPENLFNEMKKSTKISLTCSLDTRAKRIVEEYFEDESKIEEVKKIIPSLSKFMGKNKADDLAFLIQRKEYFLFSKMMLKDYYDPLYSHFTKDFTFQKMISSEELDNALKEIEEFSKTV